MGGMQRLLQANRDLFRPGRAAADVRSLQQYTQWMKGSTRPRPTGRYEIKLFATDEERKSVCV